MFAKSCKRRICLEAIEDVLVAESSHPYPLIRSNANATLQCPVQPGDYTIVQTVDLPREIPKGKPILLLSLVTL